MVFPFRIYTDLCLSCNPNKIDLVPNLPSVYIHHIRVRVWRRIDGEEGGGVVQEGEKGGYGEAGNNYRHPRAPDHVSAPIKLKLK